MRAQEFLKKRSTENLDEGVIDFISKSKDKFLRLKDALSDEWAQTKEMWEIVQKRKTATQKEINFANSQFKDILRVAGLSAWYALPIPGNTLLILATEKILNKVGMSIIPDKIRNQVLMSKQQGVTEGQFDSLIKSDQAERNAYKKFVADRAGGDWSRGARLYAKLKNRPADDIFGDDARLQQFMRIKFDFANFTKQDWRDFWLLSQHADKYPGFQKQALDAIEKHLGQGNDYYRYLADRISCARTGQQKYGTQDICDQQGVAEGKIINTYLWHGSRQKIPVLEPRQSVDTGGAAGSNQNAIYATSDPKVAIAMGLTTPGSDTGMFPNDPQMVLFSGKIRKGENVYLHRVPFNGPDGKPQFVQGGNSREFHSIPSVKEIKPIEIKAVPVNRYLDLIRKATREDWVLRKKFMRKQGVREGSQR